jgi:glycosyltransferase involved in cell wall biosynthesis
MLIGIDASRAATGQRTGTEGYALHLIRALIPAAAERGHRLRLYFNKRPSLDLFPAASHVDLAILPQERLWTHLRLRRELLGDPPDVFFTPAHVIPFGYARPSVATIHDLGYEHYPEAHPRRQLAYLRWSTRHNARVARRIVADSRATRDDLIGLYGIAAGKIDVVYPAADPELRCVHDPEKVAAARARAGIDAPYLLYLGTLQPRKNLIRLVDAFAASGLPAEGVSLVLAGRVGWLAEPLLDAIRGQSSVIRHHIHLPGYIPDEDKAALLSGALALVFPSLYEGFGFPVLEAQSCGAPVICSNTSSLPEAAGGGALLVDPLDVGAMAEAMRRVAADEALRRALVAGGYDNLARFRWGETAVSVLSTLEAAAQSSASV